MNRRLRSTAPTLAIVGLCAGVVGIGALLGFAAAHHPFAASLAALLAAIGLPMAGRLLWRTPIHPLEPLWVFLLCYAITFVLKPFLDSRGFVTYDWFTFDESNAVRAVIVSACALLFLYLGYLSDTYRIVEPLLPRLGRDPSLARGRAVAVALTIGCVVALATVIRDIGPSFSLVAASAGRYRTVVLNASYGHGYLVILCTCGIFAPGIQMFVALSSRQLVDWLIWLAVTGAVGLVLTVLYSRQLFLQGVVVMLVVSHFRTLWFSRKAIVAAGLVVLVAGGFLGLRLRERHPSPFQAFAFLGHTFDSFEFLSSALERLSPVGSLGGQSIIEDVAFTYLPRAVFPEKPDVFGVVRLQGLVAPALADYSVKRATFPPGFLVEAYANLGVVGLAIMAMVYGIGLRLAREWFWPRQRNMFALIVYGGLVLNMTGMFRSATQFALETVVFSLLLYLALYARIPLAARHRHVTAAP